MSEKSQALRLINDLLADVRDPSFVWQVVTLIACVGSAFLVARWWWSRHTEGEGRLTDASARLAFPLTGMLLTGIALSTLGSFMHLNLLKLAMPLLGSMALVRGVIFVLRQAFPACHVANRLGTHHRCHRVGLAGPLHHRSGTFRH